MTTPWDRQTLPNEEQEKTGYDVFQTPPIRTSPPKRPILQAVKTTPPKQTVQQKPKPPQTPAKAIPAWVLWTIGGLCAAYVINQMRK